MRVIEYRRRAMSQPPLPESLRHAWKSWQGAQAEYVAAQERLAAAQAEAMEATINLNSAMATAQQEWARYMGDDARKCEGRARSHAIATGARPRPKRTTLLDRLSAPFMKELG